MQRYDGITQGVLSTWFDRYHLIVMVLLSYSIFSRLVSSRLVY